jgi:hypothetical protein
MPDNRSLLFWQYHRCDQLASTVVRQGLSRRRFIADSSAMIALNALAVAQMPRGAAAQPGGAPTNVTLVIAYDATASMGPFAKDLARDITTAFEGVPADIAKGSTVGFVFYRDEFDDEKYRIVNPLPVAKAMDTLTKLGATPGYMAGGGDPAEPVLDAVYIAHRFFPWAEGGTGRRIILVVLGDDAKPLTTGKIHNGVPPGLAPAKIARDLLADNITVITVQAGPGDGAYLVPVLSTLAETTGGIFVGWGSGGDDRRKRGINAVARQVSSVNNKPGSLKDLFKGR